MCRMQASWAASRTSTSRSRSTGWSTSPTRSSFLGSSFICSSPAGTSYRYQCFLRTVLRIRDIFERIWIRDIFERIWIHGSVPLSYFAFYFLTLHFLHFSKIKISKLYEERFFTVVAWWWKDSEPDPYLVLTDPDLGGLKNTDPEPDPQHWVADLHHFNADPGCLILSLIERNLYAYQHIYSKQCMK